MTRTPIKPAKGVNPPATPEAPRVIRLSQELLLLTIPKGHASGEALTPAEREVAQLAAEGLTNAAIAGRRKTSTHTVANLLATAYAKLGISGRRELRARLNRGG